MFRVVEDGDVVVVVEEGGEGVGFHGKHNLPK